VDEYTLLLIKAWVAGSILGESAFQNIITKQIADHVDETDTLPSHEPMEYLFGGTWRLLPDVAKLKEFFIDLYVLGAFPREVYWYDEADEPWAKDFMSSVLEVFMTRRIPSRFWTINTVIRKCTIGELAS
jgi:hypothetical protein